MKLGLAYNIFNGDELLVDSLQRMREVTDYIVLTYQNTSNVGNTSKTDLHKIISSLDSHLYDEVVLFEPSLNIKPAENETKKRNLGLKYAKKNKCSHFMSIDCDEFYDINLFKKVKEKVIQNDYNSTACELVNYYHSSKNQIIAHKQYVPLIFKTTFFGKHKFAHKFPVLVDPTRVISNKNFYCFTPDELLMHHMSYVRKDNDSLRSKLENSPNKHLYADVTESYLQYFDSWTVDKPALNPHQFKAGEWDKNLVEVIDNPLPINVSYQKLF